MTVFQAPQAVAGSRIIGLGSYQPETVVSNHDLAARMDTSDEWIRERVGIVNRRVAAKDEGVVDMSVIAGSRAIEDAGLTPADIGGIIVATCTMPSTIPNAAAQIATKIGIQAAAAFDLNAACAGFCYAVATAADIVRGGSVRNILVIGAEKLTDWTHQDDRSTAIIFADGAGAVVVGASDTNEIGPVAWGSDGSMSEVIRIDDRDSFIHQEGQTVFRWATTQVAPVAIRAVELAGVELSDVDVFAPHQANLRIIEAIAKRLRKNGAREDLKVARDIVESGNTSSASIPMALDHMRAAGEISSGDVVLMVGFGAGLSYAGQVVRCP
ncbi:beta-ketoacyl-ACP synthase III [Lentzea sp. BCCO 10_0798]|uniref:Beta-ketoacyl-[acyl-carrier-protein] synthase III n=1 Tax=Lentzea kristufekii TaxID=3095430 RepID=A0ABU4TPD6_9PSEU|nr:beta-ketoacyl-ACP synthase III [Lentzea sp. BCCO 10_0798]MDX8050140.1 beta-ketoacyl-ACP synthase III [Lentzea sp. BCCO 10_0798]